MSVGRLARPAAAGGTRRTTLVRLRAGGLEGQGEDVTFQPGDALATADGLAALRGVRTLGEAWHRLDGLELFARPPEHAVVRNYRRWAVEAAALDLALRQAGLSLAERIGRVPGAVRFVISPVGSRIPHVPGRGSSWTPPTSSRGSRSTSSTSRGRVTPASSSALSTSTRRRCSRIRRSWWPEHG